MSTAPIQPLPIASLAMALARAQQEHIKRHEGREGERYPYSGRLSVGYVTKDGIVARICDGHCVDLSCDGIGFLTESQLAKGDVFTFQLTAPAREQWQIRGRIMHCTKLLEHTFRVGAQFLVG